MKRTLAIAVALCALTLAYGRAIAQTQDDRPLDPKVIAWDKGPDRIDLSKYPAEMKQKYKVYTEVCSRCHTLARAINCDFVLEDEWERYIKKMMRRSGKMITPDDAQQVFEFVLYDAKLRKRQLYDTKMAASR
jgi:hypothetical protein